MRASGGLQKRGRRSCSALRLLPVQASGAVERGKPGLKPLTLDRQEDMSRSEGMVGDVGAHSKHRGMPLSDQPQHQQ